MSRKRILSLCLTFVMILSVLAFAGCGSKKEEEKAPKPTSAEELLDAYKKAAKDVENFSFTGKGSAEIKAGSAGAEMSVPVEFDLSGDYSKDVIHGSGTASIDMMGQKEEVAPEIYIDVKNKKTYAKTTAEEDWTTSDLDVNTEDVKVEMPEAIKSELAFSEADDAYVLECDLSKIDIKELIKSVAEQAEEVGDIDAALDMIDQAGISIDSGTLTIKYDKDTCLITSMTLKEFAGSGATEITEGQNMDITASADFEFTFSDYNKVSADKFKLPEGVE